MNNDGKKVLFEGAQGALLDVDNGTYPYVTSSNSSAAGIASGSGLGPLSVSNILGIAKFLNHRPQKKGSKQFHCQLPFTHAFGCWTEQQRKLAGAILSCVCLTQLLEREHTKGAYIGKSQSQRQRKIAGENPCSPRLLRQCEGARPLRPSRRGRSRPLDRRWMVETCWLVRQSPGGEYPVKPSWAFQSPRRSRLCL